MSDPIMGTSTLLNTVLCLNMQVIYILTQINIKMKVPHIYYLEIIKIYSALFINPYSITFFCLWKYMSCF